MEPIAAPSSFREEEFQLFQEDRRANNRFNKDRLALKEKLARIGTRLLQDTVPAPWKMEIGSEHPAVWNQRQVDRLEVFFMRPEEERRILSRALAREIPLSVLLQSPSPLYGHSSLGFFLDERGIEVGFRVPFLAIGDRSQLRKLAADADWGAVVGDLFGRLEGFLFGVHSHGNVTELDFSRAEIWTQALEDLEKTGQGDHRAYLGIVKRFPVAEVVAVEDVEPLLASNLRALRSFALDHTWRLDHDLLGLTGMIEAQSTVNQAERVRSEQLRQELIQPRPVVARPIMTSPQSQAKPSAQPSAPRDNRPPRQSQPSAPRDNRPPRPSPSAPRGEDSSRKSEPPRREAPAAAPRPPRPPQPPRPPRQEKRPMTTVEPGERVILASGPFSGKEAVVLAALPDGHVRVRVGIMQMTVEMKDCMVGRD